MNKKFVFVLLSLLSFAGTASAQKYWITNDTAAHNLVWEDKLYRRIEFLSDSLCAGRATGTRGCSEAAFFIINTFRDNGLLPFSDSYVRHIYAGGGVVGHNIIGMIPGSVRIPCDSYVIVGAHYDHLGILGGKMYPGADNNASGVAALLSLNDMFSAMKKAGRAYGKSLIFVAFDAEELNVAGSGAFWKMIEDGELTDDRDDHRCVSDSCRLECRCKAYGDGCGNEADGDDPQRRPSDCEHLIRGGEE